MDDVGQADQRVGGALEAAAAADQGTRPARHPAPLPRHRMATPLQRARLQGRHSNLPRLGIRIFECSDFLPLTEHQIGPDYLIF